jgi:hypothetical protein
VSSLADICICAACGGQNRELARFCRYCGSVLETSSPERSSGQSRDAGAFSSTQTIGLAEPAAPADYGTGRDPRSHRRLIAVPLVIAVLVAAVALAGWRAGWPTAVFGARHVAATQRLGTGSGSPPAAPATGAASSPLPTPSVSPSGIPSAASGPAAVVQSYFAAINSKAYRTAWQLGGSNFSSSYSSFVNGFAATASDTATILSVSGNVVTIQLAAQQNDGTVKTYQGTYTVTGGVITGSDIQQVG